MEFASKANETFHADEIRPLSEAELDQVEGGAAPVLAVVAAFLWGFYVGRNS